MSKLDDLFGKKKEIVPVLDLSKTIIHSKEEYKRLMEKVPDFKMRPIKVRAEEIRIKEKDFSFKTPKKELKQLARAARHGGERDKLYVYLDPMPVEMRGVVVMELCQVPIDWKMLTILRPKLKIEEEFFTRVVDLGKQQLKTELKDKREYALNPCVRKIKNKSGVIELRIFCCPECGEDFCNGRSCMDFNYDLYTRVTPKANKPKLPVYQMGATKKHSNGGKNDKGVKKKKRNRAKSPSKN